MDPTLASVPVPGGRLAHRSDGDGPPILLLHAGIADLRAWDALVPFLVAAGHRVVRYDARGFGASTTEDVAYSDRADLVAVLDDHSIGRAALVGNSRGGKIAIDTTIEFPDRVVALVAIGPGVGGFEAPTTAALRATYADLDATYARLEAAGDPDGLADFDVRIWVDGLGQPPDRVPAEIREAIRTMSTPLHAHGRVTGRPIPLDPPANDRLGEIAVPTLAISGSLDTPDVIAAGERLAGGVRNGRAVVLPDVAHLVAMEAPAAVAELIGGHLADLPRWR